MYARDRVRNAPSAGSKQYLVGRPLDVFQWIYFSSYDWRCYYEVVDADQPSRLYFDIEFTRINESDMEWVAANTRAYFDQAHDDALVSDVSSTHMQ